MENVVLVILLILALCLIAVVLMQRSEGGGLGIGGGGGGVTTGRSAATALSKLTWILGVSFMAASVAMTIIAARNSADTSVVDRLGIETPAQDTGPALPPAEELLPPSGGDTPLAPPRAD